MHWKEEILTENEITSMISEIHRVYRVLSLLASRPNWNSHTPSPVGECIPPSFYSGGGGGGYTHACGRRGGGVPVPTNGQVLWYYRFYTYFVQKSTQNNQSMQKTQVCTWKAFCRKAKTKVKASSLRNLKIMPRNLNEIVLSWIPSLSLVQEETQHKIQSLADFFLRKRKKTNSYTLYACAGQAPAIFLNDQSHECLTNICAWAKCFQIFWIAACYAMYN